MFSKGKLQILLSNSAGPEARSFLARTSDLSPTYTNAYIKLINGLVEDGTFNLQDVLYIFATQNTTTALLNLKSTSFGGTANGSPSFSAGIGYTGVDASTTVYIDTGFNPSTAGGNFSQNSAQVSLWSNSDITSGAAGGTALGLTDSAGSTQLDLAPEYFDGKSYYNVNDTTGGSAGVAVTNSTGHFLANRSSSSAQQGYRNAVDQSVTAVTSSALINGNVSVLAKNKIGVGSFQGSAHQICMASIGGSLNSTQVTTFYNRLRTYMTAVGVP